MTAGSAALLQPESSVISEWVKCDLSQNCIVCAENLEIKEISISALYCLALLSLIILNGCISTWYG
jgi:hypothetical protein